MPSKYDIAERWLEQSICLIEQFGSAFVIDLGEPACMACGQHWNGRYDPKNADNISECRRAWDQIPLEKAHIIPKARGGENTPSNLILLCKDCHTKAPDVIYPEYMIRWCLSKASYHTELFVSLQEANITELPTGSEMERALSICGTHGLKIKYSSFAYALRHIMDERDRKGQLSLF
jgi:hypothetical protein